MEYNIVVVMDHSDDPEDSKPPAQPPQQQQPSYSSSFATSQQQQWNDAAAAAAAAAAQYAAAAQGYGATTSIPQQVTVGGGYVTTRQQQQQQQQELLYQQQQQQQAALVAASGFPPSYVTPTVQPSYTSLPPTYFSPQPGIMHPAGYLPPSQHIQPPPIVHHPHHHPHHHLPPAIQPPPQALPVHSSKPARLPADRPLIKLSVSLIDTYKTINTVYYESRDARRAARQKEKGMKQGAGGTNNNGWDDENYDYIITQGEMFYGRYKIKERIGKGSFGQVVRAEDVESHREVAIKIIKSKKPFLMQAKTEIELLTHLWEKDQDDQHNIGTRMCGMTKMFSIFWLTSVCFSLGALPHRCWIVRLETHFMYRNHQCLVFEMLSLNLYELLKNTQFGGVSLNLIRKFAKQVLKALAFLARSDVDIIHCDLKPENILLRHPKKSGVKIIDFGSSCRSNKRMYSYIQSRFYRSPEVMLGLPYTCAIDMWSLGCILAEMHTGEPLFSGSDQFDQMQKVVKLLGMVPSPMLDKAGDQVKNQFFVKKPKTSQWMLRQTKPPSSSSKSESSSASQAEPKDPIVPSTDPIASLTEIITRGQRQQKKFPPSEMYNSQMNYELFIDLVYKMLAYEPEKRIKPSEALSHPFITTVEQTLTYSSAEVSRQK